MIQLHDCLPGCRQFIQRLLHMKKERMAILVQFDIPPNTVKKPDPQFILQTGDIQTEGGL